MFPALVRHDLRLLLRERTLLLVAVLTLALVAYAVWSGAAWKRIQIAELEQARVQLDAAVAAEAAALEGLASGRLAIAEAPSAGLPQLVRTQLLLPPGPLAELALAEADLRPALATITAVSRAHETFRFYEVENPALLGLGRFDLAFVVIYLVPLLILGLCYNVLSADRESGAMGLLLSQPVTAAQVAWARILLRAGLVAGVLLVSIVLAWLVFRPAPVDPPVAARLALWLLVVLVYCSFWAAVVAWVVARNGSSDGNALVLLLVWATVTLLLPAAIALCAQTLSPTPSRLEYITTARAAENAANQQGRELMQGYLLDHPEIEATREDAVAPFIQTFVLVQQRVEQAVAPISREFEARLARQQLIASRLAYLSPASLAQGALAELAGTSLARHRRFEREVQALRSEWAGALERPLMSGRRLTPEEFAALPRPEFQESPLGEIVRSTVPAWAVLAAYALLAWLLSFHRFRRFEPAANGRDVATT